jgi:hypothetical protein
MGLPLLHRPRAAHRVITPSLSPCPRSTPPTYLFPRLRSQHGSLTTLCELRSRPSVSEWPNLRTQITSKESERETAVRATEEKWKGRVERLERERDLLVIERLSLGRMEEQRAVRPDRKEGEKREMETEDGEKWWDW